ncbi:MAG: hypothetical protein JWQ81_7782, partial [Amycolatopsis sp.]|nr:hypothetical protein [Amycolatopsis sp.]
MWDSHSASASPTLRPGESHVHADESHSHHQPTTPADLKNLTSHTDTTEASRTH